MSEGSASRPGRVCHCKRRVTLCFDVRRSLWLGPTLHAVIIAFALAPPWPALTWSRDSPRISELTLIQLIIWGKISCIMGSSEIQLLSLARPRPSHGSVTDYIQLLAPTQSAQLPGMWRKLDHTASDRIMKISTLMNHNRIRNKTKCFRLCLVCPKKKAQCSVILERQRESWERAAWRSEPEMKIDESSTQVWTDRTKISISWAPDEANNLKVWRLLRQTLHDSSRER